MADEGLIIRKFLRDLFGSRLNAHLEEELLRVRSDYETRLMGRERTISDLKEQLGQLNAKVDKYELVLLPLASPMGQFFTPKKEKPVFVDTREAGPKSWSEIQADWERQQEEEARAEKKQ